METDFLLKNTEVWEGPVSSLMYCADLARLVSRTIPPNQMKVWKTGRSNIWRVGEHTPWEILACRPATEKDMLELKLL